MPKRLTLPIFTACLTVVALVTPNAVAHATSGAAAGGTAKPSIAYPHLDLPGGGWALVYSDGMAEVHHGNRTEITNVPLTSPDETAVTAAGDGTKDLPPEGALISDLLSPKTQSYLPGQVVVVYAGGVTAPASVSANTRTLRATTPAYTSSPALNGLLDRLGVDRARMMFPGAAQRSTFEGMRQSAQQSLGRPLLDFGNAAVLHVTGSSVPDAVAELRASADVAFAEPDWTVGTTDLTPTALPPAAVAAARRDASRAPAVATSSSAGLPDNYALTSSAQSLLNRPGVDAVPAFADLAKYGQLPGQGEIITNVSLGTLDDASAAANSADPCTGYAQAYGPTTVVQNGQRYLDWPSMPLIPTYTASSDATLDPTGETCGDDPQLTEVGLDFSMMAPLPHDRQRAGETGSGLSDLLGIAPGASYRLVVPATAGGAISDVDAAFLGAARQTPRPNVITASIGFGLDSFGYPSRYLEDDPVTESIIASIVNSGIVVTASAGDGLRTSTNASVSPTGGAAPTNIAASARDASDLNDVAASDAPSADPDSGAIDVGGSTLNDIFAAPPDNPANAALAYLQAYPTTRFNGGRLYASGFGARVNVSAPGDSVLSVEHTFGGAADAVTVGTEGGTSASAPEAAAAVAVVLQAARLTGNRHLAQSPWALRSFLEQTGAPLGPLPEADTPINVGPQIDIGRAVETLLAAAHQSPAPGVARVAIAQRQQASALGGSFLTATDPTDIPLAGLGARDLVTISPDWTGLPPLGGEVGDVSYALTGPSGQVIARTPWARLFPSAILASAGLPLVSASPQSVTLTYTASRGRHTLASATFTLTFGPTDGTLPSVSAPLVPPVVTGSEIPVTYNLAGLVNPNPTLVVSYPGRIDTATGNFFYAAYTVPLTATSGTVMVPVAKLQGAGIYGIGIQASPGGLQSANYSTYTFIRVSPAGDAKPPVPTLSAGTTRNAHTLEIPYDGSFRLNYDVSDVPGASGAVMEVSAPGPTTFNNQNPFNNPNGSERDANGRDTGSVAYIRLPGTRGTATFNGGAIGLVPSMDHVIRVLATRGRDGDVTGEASGVATITMDGVAAADGGGVLNGFGVNQSGNDGFITSDGGGSTDSVETFDQATGRTSTVVSSTTDGYETMDGGCQGIVSNDTGLYTDVSSSGETFHLLSPVATGRDGGTWNPPASLGDIYCVAANQVNGTDAVLSFNTDAYVTPADVAAGTFGTPIDITPALKAFAIPSIGGFSVNPVTGEAQVSVTDVANLNAPGAVLDVNLATGAVSTLTGVPGFADGISVNTSLGTAGVAMEGASTGVGFTDLATGGATFVPLSGEQYEFPAAIPGTGDFIADEVSSPDSFGTHPNNNAYSSVVVVDSAGDVLHRYERFNFLNVELLNMGGYLQVNPGTSKGFALGPNGVQLEPFTFSE